MELLEAVRLFDETFGTHGQPLDLIEFAGYFLDKESVKQLIDYTKGTNSP